jgi:hypothetical protein
MMTFARPSIALGLVLVAASFGCSSSDSGSSSGGSSGTDAAPSGGDGGSGGGSDAAAEGSAGDPLNAAPTCTSGKTWGNGDHGSASMHPGTACIACHSSRGAQTYTIAGTLYPTGHEPDDCNGTASGYQIIVTDANDKQITIPVNSVGNFMYTQTVAAPYTAKVRSTSGKERPMVTSLTNGDCNSCHTQDGSGGASGRITVP